MDLTLTSEYLHCELLELFLLSSSGCCRLRRGCFVVVAVSPSQTLPPLSPTKLFWEQNVLCKKNSSAYRMMTIFCIEAKNKAHRTYKQEHRVIILFPFKILSVQSSCCILLYFLLLHYLFRNSSDPAAWKLITVTGCPNHVHYDPTGQGLRPKVKLICSKEVSPARCIRSSYNIMILLLTRIHTNHTCASTRIVLFLLWVYYCCNYYLQCVRTRLNAIYTPDFPCCFRQHSAPSIP